MAGKVKPNTFIYVPILKSKAAEKWALSHLKTATKASVCPLLELHAHREKSLTSHVESLCDDLAAAWGTQRRLYLDGIWLHGDSGIPATLENIFTTASDCGLFAIPVIRPSFGDASIEIMADIINGLGRGCLIRVTRSHIQRPESIDRLVNGLGINRNQIDLLLDYRSAAMDLQNDVPIIPSLLEWRRFIAAAGVFPKSLADYEHHIWHSIPRGDWTSWMAGIESNLARNPIFSDYTIRAPGAPADFGDPPVALRYTADQSWSVRIDGRHKAGDAPAMHAQCGSLITRPEFSGTDFSDGDSEIADTAHPTDDDGPGGPTQWLQWGLNHHIEFVVSRVGDVT